MKKYLLIFVYLFFAIDAVAQRNWTVWGNLVDPFTRKPVAERVTVELLRTDSTLVDSVRSDLNNPRERNMVFDFKIDNSTDRYLLRITHPNYETKVVPIHLKFYKKERWIEVPDISVRRLSMSERRNMLGEVTVTATKVKFYSRGDTLVYNADAFQLAEGSMLNALISQLPGAVLKDDGRIYVNGRFVESLLLNGRDFFKKDNTVLLDNLPAYMVKDLRVYEEESELSKLVGQKVDEGRYVMDVKLKRQYSIGWIGNAEGGAGTRDRYLARLFAMRFTPQSRIAFFGNINNINDVRKPGQNGEWQPSDLSGGLTSTKTAGADYNIYDKYQRFEFEGDATIKHTNNDYDTNSSVENFLPGGNTYERKWNKMLSTRTEFNTQHLAKLYFGKNKNDYFSFSPSLSYQHYDNRHNYLSGAFLTNPNGYAALEDSLRLRRLSGLSVINTLSQQRWSYGHTLQTGGDVFFYFQIPHTSDGFNIDCSASYDDAKNRAFDIYRLNQDLRNRYFDTPQKSYSYDLSSQYFWHLKSWLVMPRYTFSYTYGTDGNSIYRLDWLAGNYELGMLPSESADLMAALDRTNSYESSRHNASHTLEVRIKYNKYNRDWQKTRWDLEFTPRVVYEEKRLDFDGIQRAYKSSYRWLANPAARIVLNTRKNMHRLELQYNLNMQSPSLMSTIDLRFDSDPLNIRMGNPDLKTTVSNQLTLDYRANQWLKDTGKMLSGSIGWQVTDRAVAMGTYYDRATGVRTTTPQNVDGNWHVWSTGDFTTPLDKSKKLMLSSQTNIDYFNSVDLVSLSGTESPARSSVHNLWARENMTINYSLGKHRVGLVARVAYSNVTSSRQDFSNFHPWEFKYGVNAMLVLPWKLQLSTDISMFDRRGYNDDAMNTDDLVWNARLTRPAFHGKVVFTLDAFDILGQLSNITYGVNAQGRTETWGNSIPRYLMFRAIIKLNKEPKKK
jgi:hypothetical protein